MQLTITPTNESSSQNQLVDDRLFGIFFEAIHRIQRALVTPSCHFHIDADEVRTQLSKWLLIRHLIAPDAQLFPPVSKGYVSTYATLPLIVLCPRA